MCEKGLEVKKTQTEFYINSPKGDLAHHLWICQQHAYPTCFPSPECYGHVVFLGNGGPFESGSTFTDL